MSEINTFPDLQQANALISELLEEVKQWEGTLAGGTTLGVGEKAVRALQETRVTFGDPRSNLVQLTEELFEESGAQLNNLLREQMKNRYNFYYLTPTVSLVTDPVTRFWRLTTELNFAKQTDHGVVVHRMFPVAQWRSVFQCGIGIDVGLDANLDWNISLDSSKLPDIVENLPGELQTKVINRNQFKGFISLPQFKYEFGDPEIFTSGQNDKYAYWRIKSEELKKMGTVEFGLVLQVPKGVTMIDMEGITLAEPNINWLVDDIRDVFGKLSDRYQQILRQKNKVSSRFAKGMEKKWTIYLQDVS